MRVDSLEELSKGDKIGNVNDDANNGPPNSQNNTSKNNRNAGCTKADCSDRGTKDSNRHWILRTGKDKCSKEGRC